MTWVPWAQRRRERRPRCKAIRTGARRLTRTLAVMLTVAEIGAARPARAAATQGPATRRVCPEALDASPPSEALALKNAAQEMRAAQSWAKASRLFRDAVEELPDCATYADERLRWTLWAVDTHKQAGIADDGALLDLTVDSVARLDAIPGGSTMPDYPRLVVLRDELRAGARSQPEPPPPVPSQTYRAQAPPLAQSLGIGLMASGAPLVITGTILTGVYSARARDLTRRLGGPGGVYEQWAAADCGQVAEPGESPRCAGLRDERSDIRSDGLASNRVVIASLVLVGVGAAVLFAGLGTYLHGRRARPARRAALRLLPAPGGLVLSGSF